MKLGVPRDAFNMQVVKGIVLTRPGFEDKVKGSAHLQEIMKWLPSDLFRTCFARVREPAARTVSVCRDAGWLCRELHAPLMSGLTAGISEDWNAMHGQSHMCRLCRLLVMTQRLLSAS